MNISQVKTANAYEQINNKQGKSSDIQADFQKALLAVQDFVEDRIENGPQKFQIGSTEYSVEEWDKLMEKIDKDIENVKEEQKERFERLEKEREEKKALERVDVNRDVSVIQKVTDDDINKIV